MDIHSWETIMNDHKNERNRLIEETEKLALCMKTQIDKKVTSEQEEFKHRDVLMDAAYEALAVFVEDLLKYKDGDAEIGSDGLPSLPIVIQRFKELAEYCEDVIDEEGIEAVKATQQIGEDGQIVEQINSFKTRLQSDMNALGVAISDAEDYFNVNHGHHMKAREALESAENRKSEFLYTVFGDNDIDRAVDYCGENEASWHSKADEAWNVWDRLRKLQSGFQPLLSSDLDKLITALADMADEVRVSYINIGEDRKMDNECWTAARTLQYHVTTNTEFTSRDDALRHVIKLLHTANQTIDSDSDVILSKQRMEEMIQEKLGADVAATLAQEKTYLMKPEDVDF